MRRRRREVPEINLTPLLDILFSILFIVMMTSTEKEQDLKEMYEEQCTRMEQTISEQEAEISTLKDRLSGYADREASLTMYQKDAIILTVQNRMTQKEHYLEISQGMDEEALGHISLGIEKTENSQNRIEDLVNELVEQTDNQPIYIVFHCNKELIYTTEYRAVTEAFASLEEQNKEVFFKITEED